MGSILIKEKGRIRQCLLKQSNIFGRHQHSDFRFAPNPKLPLYWLEVRWIKDYWYWRVLNKEDITIGTGKHLHAQWKSFSKIIRLHNEISLELISDDKPHTLIENIETKEKWSIEEFKVSIEKKHGVYQWNQKQLKNASLFHHEEEYYRFWDACAQHSLTQEGLINILSSKCYLDINLSENTAIFTEGNQTLSISGEAVKILYIYASTIQDQNPWVSTQEAYETWLSHGGNPQSTMDRISWERNKLCKKLEKENVRNSRKLFVRKKEGKEWAHKLRLHPQNVTVAI